jgi:Mrp family chromosome partitioning ATPase
MRKYVFDGTEPRRKTSFFVMRRIDKMPSSQNSPLSGIEPEPDDAMTKLGDRSSKPDARALSLAAETGLTAGWDALALHEPKQRQLLRNRIVAADRNDPAAATIDQLRTRILNAMEQRGWRHLGITAPTWGCGATFMAANLGISFGRQTHIRTALMDANLREPGLAKVFGFRDAPSLLPALQDRASLEACTRRVPDNLAVVFNAAPVDAAAEVLKSSVTDRVLTRTFDALKIDVALYDLPPMLAHDDVLALSHRLDALLLVVRGGQSTSAEVREVEGLLENEIPILATVLNEAADGKTKKYRQR